MRNKKIGATVVFALAFLAGPACAEWIQQANVRLENGQGYTPWSVSQVTFATDAELNKASASFNYNAWGGRYALIPLSKGEISTVWLSGFAFCTGSFNQACLPAGKAEGVDAQGRHWQICTMPSCS